MSEEISNTKDSKSISKFVSKSKKINKQDKNMDSDDNAGVHIDLSIINEIMEENNEDLFFNRNKDAENAIKVFLSNEHLNSLVVETKNMKIKPYFIKMIKNNCDHMLTVQEGMDIDDIKDIFRKSVYITFKKTIEVFEGEVVNIKYEKNDNGDIKRIEMTLKTNKSSKTFEIEPYLANSLVDINIGDVVYIEPSAGFIKRLGRSENCINEYDLEGDKYIQLSKQPVNLKKIRNTTVSLYDIDFSINKYSDKISDIIRERTNEIVEEYLNTKVAVLEKCCLIILSFEKFSSTKIRTLVNLHREIPSIKLLLVGNLENFDSYILNDFSKIQLNDLNQIDFLKLKHKNFNEFENEISLYLDKVNIEIISDLINLSKDKTEFLELIEMQIKNSK